MPNATDVNVNVKNVQTFISTLSDCSIESSGSFRFMTPFVSHSPPRDHLPPDIGLSDVPSLDSRSVLHHLQVGDLQLTIPLTHPSHI